jgi:hypothetical protein
VAKQLRAVLDDEVAGDTLLGGLEESDGMAFDLCRDLTKSDEPTDLGSLRVVEICPLPSSLTWLSDGFKRFRARFALDLESQGQLHHSPPSWKSQPGRHRKVLAGT